MFSVTSTPAPFLQLPVSARLPHLINLRSVAIGGQLAAIGIAQVLGIALPLTPMLLVIVALGAFNVWSRLRLTRNPDVPAWHVPLHLAIDLVAFVALVGASGGVDNPFVFFLLLHVVVAGLMLRAQGATWATLFATLFFLLLLMWNRPLAMASGDPVPANWYAWGGAVAFVLTAFIVVWVVVRMVQEFDHQQMILDAAAQKSANDAAVLHIGSLAAGAAHELGTPLATMAVVVGEMRRAPATPEIARDAEILTAQIKACRDALGQFAAAAGYARADSGGRQRVDRFFESTADAFRATRRELELTCQCTGEQPAPEIFTDQALKQATLILLNNAADASPEHVELLVKWTSDRLTVAVCDRGRGFSESDLPKLGRTFFTTKAPGKGTGLGLVLATSAIARLAGTIQWENRSGGGACARIEIPLHRLLLDKAN